MLGKINLMENIILGWWMSREIPPSVTIDFISGFFLQSSVTSDYNEPGVWVTHVRGLIFYLAALCAAATLARGRWLAGTLVRTRINRVIEMFSLLNSYKVFGVFLLCFLPPV